MGLKNESCGFLVSNKKATFCGCKRVGRYGDSEIELIMCDVCVTLRGKNLLLSTFASGEICVQGEIEALEFKKKDGKGA